MTSYDAVTTHFCSVFHDVPLVRACVERLFFSCLVAFVDAITTALLTHGLSVVLHACAGTFGQAALWELRNESTYKHPRRPRNVQAYLSAGGSSSHLAVDVVDTTGSEEVSVLFMSVHDSYPHCFSA